jgi:hypothetical protein
VSDLACSKSSGDKFPLSEKNATSDAENSAEKINPAIMMALRMATAPQSTPNGPIPGSVSIVSVV